MCIALLGQHPKLAQSRRVIAPIEGRETLVPARPCRGGQDNEQDGKGGGPLHGGIAGVQSLLGAMYREGLGVTHASNHP